MSGEVPAAVSTSRLERFIVETRVGSLGELAAALGLDASTVSRKVAGARPWKLDEIQAALAWFSQRLGRVVTFEETFAAEAEPADQVEASASAVSTIERD